MDKIEVHIDVVRTDGLPNNHLMDVFLAIHQARFQIDHWTRVPGGRWAFGISYAGMALDVHEALRRLMRALGQQEPADLVDRSPIDKAA